jgi:hypothetical protein
VLETSKARNQTDDGDRMVGLEAVSKGHTDEGGMTSTDLPGHVAARDRVDA